VQPPMSLLHRAVREKDNNGIIRRRRTRVRPAAQRSKGRKGSGKNNKATRKRKPDTNHQH